MGAIFYKQPNGRYCRYSTVVDCVTDYNMSKYDIIKLFVEDAIDSAEEFIDNEKNFHKFEELTEKYEDLGPDEEPLGEMTVNEFKNLKKQMEEPESFRTFWRKT
jgi:hypothetical protein